MRSILKKVIPNYFKNLSKSFIKKRL